MREGSLSDLLGAHQPRSRRTVRLAKRPANGDQVYQRSDDWGAIARIYDLEHPACRGAELRFWREMVAQTGGTALELATGSGRIALALASKGHRVTGLELSQGMLARAKQRKERLPPQVQERMTFVLGDMSDFDLRDTPGAGYPSPGFGLIFVAYNSFWLLNDPGLQLKCLQCVRRHLAPDGRFVLDVFPPTPDDYQNETGIAQWLPTTMRGQTLLRVKDYTFDSSTQLATSDVRYYTASRTSEQPTRHVAQFRYTLRPAPPDDVRALLESQGFTVEATYGSYERDPLTPDAPRAIFVARD
jgi:SAM-dependent methyltransferase